MSKSLPAPLKIEMVVDALVLGGLEAMVIDLAQALRTRGHDVGITCVSQGGVLADRYREQGGRLHVVEAHGLLPLAWPHKMGRWLAEVSPDVVHCHSGGWVKGVPGARWARVPRVVHTSHGLSGNDGAFGPMLMRHAARSTDMIVVVSELLRDFFVNRCRIPASKIVHVPNGIDVDKFRRGPRRPRDIWPALTLDGPVIGSVGRLVRVKNYSMLLRAFAIASEAIPSASLVIVGEGPLRQELTEEIDRLGLTGKVLLPGFAPDPKHLYASFDVFVLSSDLEGTSMSLLEAMATEVCSVVTDVGGNRQVLGTGGLVVPPNDPGALGSALIRVLGDEPERMSFGKQARTRVLEHFTREHMLEAYERLYMSNDRGVDFLPLLS